MTIAELFVTLGVKGDGPANKALGGVKKGLGDVKSMSLEAKAGILGVIYGLERLMSSSNLKGTQLQQFAELTGLSVEKLQHWQYAARQTGVAADDITSSIKSVQASMMDMLTGKGAPSGMGILSRAIGFDPSKARDTFYVMDKLKEFAKLAPPDLGNNVLKSFGLSEGTIQFLRMTKIDLDKIKPSNIYSSSEIAQLRQVDVAWSNLFEKVKMGMGHLNAKEGLKIVSEIGKATDEILKLVSALAKLADKIKIFEAIGMVFKGWADIFGLVNQGIDGLMSGKENSKELAGPAAPKQKPIMERLTDYLANGSDAQKNIDEQASKFITPRMGPPLPPSGTQSTTINQNLNFQHDGTEPQKVADTHKKSINEAMRQMQAQGQGT